MMFAVERTPRQSAGKPAATGAAVALGLVFALSLGGGEARAQVTVCTPTQTASDSQDADGRYTTMIVCADTDADEGEADYRHLHYNQDTWNDIYGSVLHTNAADRDTTIPNNRANNNVSLVVGPGTVFTATGGVDMRELYVDGAIALWQGGAKTVTVQEGATINLRRTPGVRADYYPSSRPKDRLEFTAAVFAQSDTAVGGDINIAHMGVINLGLNVQGAPERSSGGYAIIANIDDTRGGETRADNDITVELGRTGVIRQLAGNEGMGGVHAQNFAEDGDITIDLARGSLIELTVQSGAAAVRADIPGMETRPDGEAPQGGKESMTGTIAVTAAGTIRTARLGAGPGDYKGVGIVTVHEGVGDTRIVSSGAIDTIQATAIIGRALGADSARRDDPATGDIEGNLVDVTGGRVLTRGNRAIYVETAGAGAAWTVRVGEGATVRADYVDFDALVPDGGRALADFGTDGGNIITPTAMYGWRQVDTDGDGTDDSLEPIVNAIAVERSRDAADGVVDRVIVDGTAQTVGGRREDAVIFFQRGNAEVTVGPKGKVLSNSGVAIASGAAGSPGAESGGGGLSVTVARGGMVKGDIRAVNGGDLTATVAGTVTGGDIHAMNGGDLTATVARGGTVTGNIRAMNGGDLTATVAGTVCGDLRTEGAGDLTVTLAGTGAICGDLRTEGAGDLTVTLAGTVDGELRTEGAGNLAVTVAEGGRIAYSKMHTANGNLKLTVRQGGTVTGDLAPPGGGALTLSVLEGGAVPGTVNDPADPLTVAGSIGRLLYSNGGRVTVTATGALTGIEGVALRSDAGALDVTVAGRVAGDLRAPTGGTLKLSVLEGGAVPGTVHDPSGVLTVAGSVGRVLYSNGGRVTVAATGALTGIEGVALRSETGALDVTVAGRVAGDLRAPTGGTLKLSVLKGGVIPGTVHDPAGVLTVAGSVGRVLYTNGGSVTVAATGALTGIEGVALRSEAGALDVTVAGRVAGDLRPPTGGTLKLSVPEGGVVTGTVHDPEGPLTVAGGIGRLLYSKGGAVTVAATGRIAGVDGEADAIRSETGDLSVTVAGHAAGDIRAMGGGALTLSVPEGGVVTGTAHDPASPLTVAGSIGRLLYSDGGTVTVAAKGKLTGVDGVALRSETGDLEVTVAGAATGDILGLGEGDHTVTVSRGGTVTGTVRLASSTVRVDGLVTGAVVLDRGGEVTVGWSGRIDGVGVRSMTGDFTGTIAGAVTGDVVALGSGAHRVSVAAGGQVTREVRAAAAGSAVTVEGAVGRVRLDRGGAVTVGEVGRVTGVAGDGGPVIRSDTGALVVMLRQASDETVAAATRRVAGRIVESGGAPELKFLPAGSTTPVTLGALGTSSSIPMGAFDLGAAPDGAGVRFRTAHAPRARVYEALPSVLLGLNAPSGFHERMTAPRSPNGVWARAAASSGSREAKRSASASGGLSWEHNGLAAESGLDAPLGDGALMGVSAHHRRVTAELSGNSGDIEVVGNGVGASLAVDIADGVYADVRLSATSYSADLSSGARGSLGDVDGLGYAASLEAGRRMALGEGAFGESSVTPRAGVLYSQVDMDSFTDSVGSRVSLEEGVATTGRAGARVETRDFLTEGTLLFGSLDVEHEFAPETRMRVSGTDLESESEATRVRAALGGSVEWRMLTLQAAARYATGAEDYGGGVSLKVSF